MKSKAMFTVIFIKSKYLPASPQRSLNSSSESTSMQITTTHNLNHLNQLTKITINKQKIT